MLPAVPILERATLASSYVLSLRLRHLIARAAEPEEPGNDALPRRNSSCFLAFSVLASVD